MSSLAKSVSDSLRHLAEDLHSDKASTPPAPVDWTEWEPAGQGDVRSPCPMLNALANHHVLPHSGHGITKPMAIEALTHSINLSPSIASVFASKALTTNPDHSSHSFDLSHLAEHGNIEHDVSLSRSDIAFGDNHTYNPAAWHGVLATYEGKEMTDFASVSKARYERLTKVKKEHELQKKSFQYGIKEFILSYGESALLLGLLGSPKEGKIPVEYLKVLIEEERLPFTEGWKPSDRPITQNDMNHLIFSLIAANEHKLAEAEQVGLGTVQAVQTAVSSVMPSYCSIM